MGLPLPLMIFSILFVLRFGKVFLILRISLVLLLDFKAWTYNFLSLIFTWVGPCHMQVHLSRKLHPHGDATSEPYKPTFHSGHLSRNTSYGGAATLRIFHLPWRGYSYSTQSSMMELLLSVSRHWNLRLGQ